MFSVSLSSVLSFLVDNFLDRDGEIVFNEDGTYTRPGLYIKFPIRVSNHKDEKSSSRDVVLVFAGNTSVWYHVYDGIDDSVEWNTLINSSNHDSCWRHDGLQFLHNLYFQMCKEVDPERAPITLDSEQSFLLWTDILPCQVTYSPRDENFCCGLVDVKFNEVLI